MIKITWFENDLMIQFPISKFKLIGYFSLLPTPCQNACYIMYHLFQPDSAKDFIQIMPSIASIKNNLQTAMIKITWFESDLNYQIPD